MDCKFSSITRLRLERMQSCIKSRKYIIKDIIKNRSLIDERCNEVKIKLKENNKFKKKLGTR